MEYLKVFLTGGFFCVIAQILIDKTQLKSGRILVFYVCIGCILGGLGIYQHIVNFGGAGATVPLLGYGYNMSQGVIREVKESGLIGVFTGGLKAGAGGITLAILFAFIAALIFEPKAKS